MGRRTPSVSEGRRLKPKVWGLYIALMFLISFAFGFALFMLMREQQLTTLTTAGESHEAT